MTNERFATVSDSCSGNLMQQELLDTVVITLSAVSCGADGRPEGTLLSQASESWPQTIVRLPGPIPSRYPFGPVMTRFDLQALRLFREAGAGESGAHALCGGAVKLRRTAHSANRRCGRSG